MQPKPFRVHPGLARRSRIHGVDLTPVFEPPAQPSRGTLIWRGAVIAFALVMASGVWDSLGLTQLAWLLAFMGLGTRTMAARVAGTVLGAIAGVLLTGGFPPRTVYGIGTPEEIAHNLRFARVVILGVVVSALVAWTAGAVRPRLRALGERVDERRA